MKIIKKKLTESTNLTEAKDDLFDDVAFDDEPEAAEIKDDAQLTKTVAGDIAAQGKTPTNAAVAAVKKEVKYASSLYDINIFAPLGNKNELTEVLDDSLEAVLSQRALASALKKGKENSKARKRLFSRANVLIEGLPGSGKTAIVKAWADSRGLNLQPVNAKQSDLELAINGAVMRDASVQNSNAIAMAYSKYLAPLERPNSILFLDELNRQTDPQIRASLLTLVGEHCIYGEVASGKNDLDRDHDAEDDSRSDGYYFFPNLLFTVACINPSVPEDQGAAELNDAELSRFYSHPQFNSTRKRALEYFRWHYEDEKKRLDPDNEFYVIAYKTFATRLSIAEHLLENSAFSFDSLKDLPELYRDHYTMLNQRLLADVIDSLKYSDRHGKNMAEQFKNWLGQEPTALAKETSVDKKYDATQVEDDEERQDLAKAGLSNLLPRDKKMLLTLLNTWEQPEIVIPGIQDSNESENILGDEEDEIDNYEDDNSDISKEEIDAASQSNSTAKSSILNAISDTINTAFGI